MIDGGTMKSQTKFAVVLGALALMTAPAMALAVQPADPGHGHGQSNGPKYTPATPETPGPGASLPEKAKAYGVHCQGQSKKHVKGEKGTPFSQCVTAMAKAATDERLTPKQACKELSKKHVKGEKGTPFSRCVVAAAQVKREAQQG
jgi:Spy/CpxP family protein refolding chaperone